eukprot:scaffold109276_cov21-Tisochrysis_lutea.AAC.3
MGTIHCLATSRGALHPRKRTDRRVVVAGSRSACRCVGAVWAYPPVTCGYTSLEQFQSYNHTTQVPMPLSWDANSAHALASAQAACSLALHTLPEHTQVWSMYELLSSPLILQHPLLAVSKKGQHSAESICWKHKCGVDLVPSSPLPHNLLHSVASHSGLAHSQQHCVLPHSLALCAHPDRYSSPSRTRASTTLSPEAAALGMRWLAIFVSSQYSGMGRSAEDALPELKAQGASALVGFLGWALQKHGTQLRWAGRSGMHCGVHAHHALLCFDPPV